MILSTAHSSSTAMLIATPVMAGVALLLCRLDHALVLPGKKTPAARGPVAGRDAKGHSANGAAIQQLSDYQMDSTPDPRQAN
jgi:hypothetical protein